MTEGQQENPVISAQHFAAVDAISKLVKFIRRSALKDDDLTTAIYCNLRMSDSEIAADLERTLADLATVERDTLRRQFSEAIERLPAHKRADAWRYVNCLEQLIHAPVQCNQGSLTMPAKEVLRDQALRTTNRKE